MKQAATSIVDRPLDGPEFSCCILDGYSLLNTIILGHHLQDILSLPSDELSSGFMTLLSPGFLRLLLTHGFAALLSHSFAALDFLRGYLIGYPPMRIHY